MSKTETPGEVALTEVLGPLVEHAMLVTVFRKLTISEKLARLWPPEARRQDERMKAEIRRLVENPDEPCIIGNVLVPNGHGGQDSMQRQIFG